MAEVKLPQLGETVTEGTITKWFKKVGDAVAADEPLFEVSTDKVDTEVPSPVSGILTEVRAKEGDTVPVGAVIAVVGDAGAAPAPAPAAAPTPEPAAAPARTLVRSYDSQGVTYHLYDDGSIDVSFSNKDGPIAFIYPELKGKTSINYKVRMDRKITVKNDPVCDKV